MSQLVIELNELQLAYYSSTDCGDVVKKPKLDQHRTQCHGGFDCIDCSTTFNSPAEYKGHTSCISEAEKYQKGLYKGPKMVCIQ
jgi:cell growth-regulating nucleolar protein